MTKKSSLSVEPGPPAAGARRRKAVWWFYPSLLEPCDGPWGKCADYGYDPVQTWRAIIDWAAGLGVDCLIPGIEPYLTDRVYNQWGFHYLCFFPDDPDARCFDDDTIRRNIAAVRAIAGYGRARGVAIMFHHYNLMAPERWAQAHPALWRKYLQINDPVWGRAFRNDRLGNLVANLCWSEPDYRAFMQRCWREVFANAPELAGILITPGEFNFCGCEQCAGGSRAHIFQLGAGAPPGPESPDAQRIREEKRRAMTADFVRVFQAAMQAAGKSAIVRTWTMPGWAAKLPQGLEYAVKYSVFDACWGGPDPVIHDWIASGHRMWETVAIEAENCGPVMWHDPEWSRVTARRINDLPVLGCLIHINTQWGHTGHIGSFTASRNITRLLEALDDPAAIGDSEREFAGFFGRLAGPAVFQAVKLIAAFPLHMTSVVHLAREGFSFGMPPWFDGPWRWPGVLGHPRCQPEPWANPDGLTTIYEMLRQVAARPDSYRSMLDAPQHNAISRCDEIAAWCEQGRRLLEECPPPATPAARGELRALAAGAAIAALAAREHAAVLRARVAWEAVKSPQTAPAPAAEARDEAARWYGAAVEALRRQIPWAMVLARIYPDFVNHVVESQETFNRLPFATRLRIRREELRRIETAAGPDWDEQMRVEFWPHLPHSIGSGAGPARAT